MDDTPVDPGSEESWFSAVLCVICFVDSGSQDDLLQDEIVHVFRAPDHDAAFLRALELGREHEHEYLNHEDSVVQWRFESIVKLQRISSGSIDGAEVYSTLSWTDFRPFATTFEPWAHLPDEDVT